MVIDFAAARARLRRVTAVSEARSVTTISPTDPEKEPYVPFKVTFQPFQYPEDHTPMATAATTRAVADVMHLPCELWATVEPCDAHGRVTGPPVDVRLTRDRVALAASSEVADA